MTAVASQTSPPMGMQPQNYLIGTEQLPGNETGNKPVPFFSYSNNRPIEIQESKKQTTTTLTRDTTFLPLTIRTPLFEEGF